MEGGTFPQRLGRRVLILEPNPGAGEIIVEVLAGAGFHPIGPYNTLGQAEQWVKSGTLEGAVLEMNIGGFYSFEFASALIQRGTPVIFFSHCDRHLVPTALRRMTVLQKPGGIEDLAEAAAAAFTGN
jgi:hypothetical protein